MKGGRIAELEAFFAAVRCWAEQQADITGMLLVGSCARGSARADSDVDLIILTDRPGLYLDSVAWAGTFGDIVRWQKEDWGKVVSPRAWYASGLEVEYGFTRPDWAAPPMDAGTSQVISGGVRMIFDREEKAERMKAEGIVL